MPTFPSRPQTTLNAHFRTRRDVSQRIPMTATVRLKLPADLKHRLERSARAANRTPQAFMRAALTREVHSSELAANDAAEELGNTVELASAFDSLAARVAARSRGGPKTRRPRGSR
jgi:predicted transcriptional regulator